MQFNAKIVLGLISALSLAACSGGGGGGENKKYAASTADFQELSQNLARVPTAANASQKNKIEEVNKNAVSEEDTVLREKSRRMQEAMGQCQVDMSTPDSGRSSTNQNIKMSLKISGAACPVAANYEFTMLASDTQMSMNILMDLKITDADLAKMNDVSAANIVGAFKATSGGGNGTLTGKIESQKFGTVAVNGSMQVSGNQNSSVVSAVVSFNIKGEITELSIKQENSASGTKNTYMINGKAVTEKEFQDTTKDLSFLNQSLSFANFESSDSAAGF